VYEEEHTSEVSLYKKSAAQASQQRRTTYRLWRMQANQVINGSNISVAYIPDRTTDEAIHISKEGQQAMNRQLGSYQLSHCAKVFLAPAGPVVWSSLPAAVREADSLHSSRRKLKTHLFTLCYSD